MLQIHQFPCLSDNYGFLVHEPASGATATIDTPDAEEILRQAEAKGWRITDIWNTHWHPDHAGGNAAIKAATGARVTGPAEVERIGASAGSRDRRRRRGEAWRHDGARARRRRATRWGTSPMCSTRRRSRSSATRCFRWAAGDCSKARRSRCGRACRRSQRCRRRSTLYCAHEYTEANARVCDLLRSGQSRSASAHRRGRNACAPKASRQCR